MREISIGEIRKALARRWKLVGATALLGLLAAAAVVLFMEPVYRTEALLAPAGDDNASGLAALGGQLGGLAAMAGISTRSGTQSKDEAIALLKSRSLTEAFIRENELLPVLFADEWDPQAAAWRSADPEDRPTMAEAFRLFDEQVRSVSENPRTGLVTLAIEWTDPERAKAWADDLVQRVNRETRTRTIREAEQSLKYLDEQLQKTDVIELRKSIYNLIESQTKRMMLASVREDYAFRVIDPAPVPDHDDPERPRPVAYALLGTLAGILLGILVALLLAARSGFAGASATRGPDRSP